MPVDEFSSSSLANELHDGDTNDPEASGRTANFRLGELPLLSPNPNECPSGSGAFSANFCKSSELKGVSGIIE